MGLFKDHMFPDHNMVDKVEVGGEVFEIEFRAPKWSEVLKAEALAARKLRDIIERPIVNDVVMPYSDDDMRLLTQQVKFELCQICLIRVGETSTSEPNFWDRLPASVHKCLADRLATLVWDTEVGRKNWLASQSQPGTGRKMRKLRAATPSPTTPTSGE